MDTTKTLKIEHIVDGVLAVNLSDILCRIPDGEHYTWSLLWVTATGKDGDANVLDFEQEVNKASNGLLLTWSELLELSERFYQIIELLVIADEDKSNLRRYDTDEEMYDSCSYVLELVDSSYWIVSIKNDIARQRLKSELAGVTEY